MGLDTAKWFRFPQANGDVRYWLYVDGEQTPYFIDAACHRAHYSYGHRIGLWGAGFNENGGAGFCGGFDRLYDAKEAAICLLTEITPQVRLWEEAENRANTVSTEGAL